MSIAFGIGILLDAADITLWRVAAGGGMYGRV
jgi:hypothetical protein